MSSRLIVNSIRHTGASSDAITLDSAGKCSFPNGGAGKILQVVETVKTDTASQVINTVSDFNPSYLRRSITTTGSNKVLVEGFISISMTGVTNSIMIGLRRNNSDVGVGDASGSKRRCTVSSFITEDHHMTAIPFSFLDSPSAGTHEYHLQFSHSSGSSQTIFINRTYDDIDTVKFPRTISLIRCSEVAV